VAGSAKRPDVVTHRASLRTADLLGRHRFDISVSTRDRGGNRITAVTGVDA
jgi:hypothetical protein